MERVGLSPDIEDPVHNSRARSHMPYDVTAFHAWPRLIQMEETRGCGGLACVPRLEGVNYGRTSLGLSGEEGVGRS